MPIYEYRCSACGHLLEAFQKMSEAPLTTCPNCHKTTLNKLVSSSTFQLKGTGWYKTDFANKGKPKEPTEQSTTETNTKTAKTEKTDSTNKSKSKTSDSSGSSDKSSAV